MPSRYTLTHKLIPNEVAYVRERIQKELEDVTQINLTTDNWTSITNKNFVAITGHWIGKDYIMYERVLVVE